MPIFIVALPVGFLVLRVLLVVQLIFLRHLALHIEEDISRCIASIPLWVARRVELRIS